MYGKSNSLLQAARPALAVPEEEVGEGLLQVAEHRDVGVRPVHSAQEVRLRAHVPGVDPCLLPGHRGGQVEVLRLALQVLLRREPRPLPVGQLRSRGLAHLRERLLRRSL